MAKGRLAHNVLAVHDTPERRAAARRGVRPGCRPNYRTARRENASLVSHVLGRPGAARRRAIPPPVHARSHGLVAGRTHALVEAPQREPTCYAACRGSPNVPSAWTAAEPGTKGRGPV